ncbi:M24 family metallopeptidase [Sphingomonas baiyangensis]|uniref:Aminopeptidase P family protein n=1 Tax=Sphingomonas baiyangensis TaxID=2572576 RepID=A0A4U1L1I6_9SPHN|nr:Xaa-Pro peptidase family protein [Sphingomonas baiyangensis]TKD49983.1 aminopeptidase P family protein [Sphingomonas baiyangensis]
MSVAIDRRRALALGGMVAAGAVGAAIPHLARGTQTGIAAAAPIGTAERQARMAKAQRLMQQAGIGAMLVEAGSSLRYFTGIDWWRSERLTAALIPAEGPLCVVTPFFEEPSIREMLAVPGDVRVWQEDESPHALVAGWLREKRLADRPVAIEETVRYFAIDGLQKALPGVKVRSGADIVNACRMVKSPAEIALMQRASDITIAAYRATAPQIVRGIDGPAIFAIMAAEMRKLGAQTPSGGVQLNEGSALPHGSKERQVVRDGSVILMDCGCTIDGYHADISRTMVFGEADAKQRRLFEHVRLGQDVAMQAARVGRTAGSVDDAVRARYEKLGYGPGYRLPGLSHRTGHGIGLDVHEPVNLVHGEATPLAAGMCFSNEPGLYVPGSYGVRIEDCFYMTASGPRYFSQPPRSIDEPFA